MSHRYNPGLTLVVFFLLHDFIIVTRNGRLVSTAFAGQVVPQDSSFSSSSSICSSSMFHEIDGNYHITSYFDNYTSNFPNISESNRTMISTKSECENQNEKERLTQSKITKTINNNETHIITNSNKTNDNDNENYKNINAIDRSIETSKTSTCTDNHEMCTVWTERGECINNPRYMFKNCRMSCQVCKEQIHLGNDIGVSQDGIHRKDKKFAKTVRNKIRQAREYLKDQYTNGIVSEELLKICRNEHKMCSIWAVRGECEKTPEYMKLKCGPVCNSCDYLERCKFDQEEADRNNLWGPGDMNKMFEKITSEPYLSKHSVKILSSPKTTDGGPWLISMENVLSEYEAKRLIELGHIEGYKRSALKHEANGDYIGEDRTSSNSWCSGQCYEDNVTQIVVQRLSTITGIPIVNSESLQMLKYDVGQFYKTHNDYIEDHRNQKVGVRVLTAYMYLNDVQGGGETSFPMLNHTVQPKRGRMVLWPSVLDDKPTEMDDRTKHSALTVTKGVKYGANAWFHQRDFKTPYRDGCI